MKTSGHIHQRIRCMCLPVSILITLSALCLACRNDPPLSYARLVNPFIGTGGHGHTFPGATLPFGMVQLSPDTRLEGWDACGGYHYDDRQIYGFSHTHLSGTGVADYCDILLMPFQGKAHWQPSKYASPFRHETEMAWAGYYAVTLEKHHIRAELSATRRCGIHRYTFTDTVRPPRLLLDLHHRDKVLDSYFTLLSDTEVVGLRRSSSWNPDQHVYFCMRFSSPVRSVEAVIHNKPAPPADTLRGLDVKSAFTFSPRLHQLVVRVGLSAVSIENARLNLQTELPHSNFDSVVNQAEATWNQELAKIEVRGAPPEDLTIFYTAFYHCLLAPHIFSDVNGQYRGRDGRIHQAEGFEYYTVFSLWDTYRALHPLLALTHPRPTRDWIHTFLAQYQEGGALPVWELASAETHCMIGYHAVPVILEAWVRGIRDFDPALALQAMVAAATDSSRRLHLYDSLGFLSNDLESESVSKTAEYSYDDWCIAQFARLLGRNDVYQRFRKRAFNYRNLFDPETHFLRGKVQGLWYSPFDPREINNFYTEANAYQYALAPVHDLEGLIKLHGGPEPFAAFLDSLFNDTRSPTGRQQPDVSGLIGQYAHGNEPSHHLAYLYNYCGRPWRTQELVRRICKQFYTNRPDGLIGNEDCGQMSAWYVWSAIGFYPVTPGSGYLSIGAPLFPEVILHLAEGKKVHITTRGPRPDYFYVKDVRINGQRWYNPWIGPELFTYGGAVEFKLGPQPAPLSGDQDDLLPPSRREDHDFVAVPGVECSANPFRDSVKLRFTHVAPPAAILVKIPGADTFQVVKGSITFRNPGTVETFTALGSRRSPTVAITLHRVRPDMRIAVQTTAHPLYRGFGPDMLIDSVMRGPNWHSGLWQGYFGVDFEAVLDLGAPRRLRFGGVHVLQDYGAWILFPRRVIWAGSHDGRLFKKIAEFRNTEPAQEGPARTLLLGGPLRGTWRWLRVKALNGGPLPRNHPSGGQPAYLFIDEVLVY